MTQQPPTTPTAQIWCPGTSGVSQNWITFEREEISDCRWDSGKYNGAAGGRTVWGPKVPTLKGTETSLSYVQCFLYLISSSVNVSVFFLYYMAGYLLDRPCIYAKFTSFVLLQDNQTWVSESLHIFTYLFDMCIQVNHYIIKWWETTIPKKWTNKNYLFFSQCLNFLKSPVKNAKIYPLKIVL